MRQLFIAETDDGRRRNLCDALKARWGESRVVDAEDARKAVAAADGIVNATPVGMAKYPGTPFDLDLLRRDLFVVDIVYFPLETQLLAAARALGCRIMGGGGMAVYQAVQAMRLFTGVEPDAERMRGHFETLTGQMP